MIIFVSLEIRLECFLTFFSGMLFAIVKKWRCVMRGNGFSLIELLIVITIISILIVIAVPQFKEMKMRANETWVLTYMRSWVSAQEIYKIKHGVYADSDEALVMDGEIAAPTVGDDPKAVGYGFFINGSGDLGDTKAVRWEGYAYPVSPGVTGRYFFFVCEDGVIRYRENGWPNRHSPPIGSQ